MATVKVRAKEGRRAFYQGKELAHDKYTQVNETDSVVRMRDHWGDIEQEGFTPPPDGGLTGGQALPDPEAQRRRQQRQRPVNPEAKE